MLIALSQGPVAAADAAPGAAGAASSAGGLSTPAVGMGAGLLTGEESLGPHTPCCSFDATGCRLLGWQASDHTPRACTSGCTSSSEGRDISESMRFVGRPGACTSEDAGFPAKAAERSGSAGSKGRQMVPAEVHPARQKARRHPALATICAVSAMHKCLLLVNVVGCKRTACVLASGPSDDPDLAACRAVAVVLATRAYISVSPFLPCSGTSSSQTLRWRLPSNTGSTAFRQTLVRGPDSCWCDATAAWVSRASAGWAYECRPQGSRWVCGAGLWSC